MKAKNPPATRERSHTWDDTPENRAHLDALTKRAKQLRGRIVARLSAKERKKFARVAKWHEEAAAEMTEDFAAQKGAA